MVLLRVKGKRPWLIRDLEKTSIAEGFSQDSVNDDPNRFTGFSQVGSEQVSEDDKDF